MSSYWEKLVDLYVDDECSREERLAFEAQVKVDPNLARVVEQTKYLRALMREIPSEPPKEFEARLRDAILSSPAWESLRLQNGAKDASNAPRARPRRLNASRVFNPVAVGVAASALIGAAVLWACLTLSWNKGASRAELAESDPAAETAKPNADALIQQPSILIPSPAGNDLESTSKADSQENYWVVVRLDDAAQLKKQKQNLQTLCAKLDVTFSKSDKDEQFRLKDVSKEQWLQIADALDEFNCEYSKALANWDDGVQKTQTIRVAFKLESK